MSGYFCDCFGGFQSPLSRQNDEKRLDPAAIKTCLQAVNEYQLKETTSHTAAPHYGPPPAYSGK